MEKKRTNSDEIFEILLRDALAKKLTEESEMLMLQAQEHKFGEKFSKGIKRTAKSIGSAENRRLAFKIASRTALTAACSLGIVFCLLLTQPNVYAAVNETVRNVFTGYDNYTFNEQGDTTILSTELRLEYVPENYEPRTAYFSKVEVILIYENLDGNQLDFSYGLAIDGTNLFIDNDNHIYTAFVENGTEYHYYEAITETDYNIIMWFKDGYYFQLSAQLDKDILVQIAENVK